MATFRDLSSRRDLEILSEQFKTRSYTPRPSYQSTQRDGPSTYRQLKNPANGKHYRHSSSSPSLPPHRNQQYNQNTFFSHSHPPRPQYQTQNNSTYQDNQYYQYDNYYVDSYNQPPAAPWQNRNYGGYDQNQRNQNFAQEQWQIGETRGGGHDGYRFSQPGWGETRGESGVPGWTVPTVRPPHKPWITQELKKLIRERNEAERTAVFTQKYSDWNRFRALRAELAPIMNQAKFDYECFAPKTKGLFYCDPCDKTCPDQESLDAHKTEHMICKLDGCTFTAHPKVVVKHIQMQHSTDLYEKIAGYKTPEEIKVWINERKKSYPTASNIERKKAERAEQIQRGERMSKPSKKKDGLYTLGQAKRKVDGLTEKRNELRMKRLGMSQRYVHVSGNKSEVVTLKSFYASVKSNSKGVLEGKELTLWKNYTGYRTGKEKPEPESGDELESPAAEKASIPTFSDDEDEVEAPSQIKKSKLNQEESTDMSRTEVTTVGPANKVVDQKNEAAPSVGLLALAAYNSDSELEDGEISEGPDEVPIGREDPNQNSINEAQVVGASNSINTLRPEQSTTVRGKQRNKRKNPVVSLAKNLIQKARKVAPNVDPNENGNTEQHEASRVKSEHSKKQKPKIIQRKRRRPRMLEHLLAPEIMKERNEILQICRFIADNNFFEGITEDMNLDSSDEDESKNELNRNAANGDVTLKVEVCSSEIVPK